MSSDAATIEDLLQPLRDDPEHSAVLLDVDGVLAPIVAQPDDAHMPETTRRPLIEVAKRYGTVACVSGRRASDARRIVSLGSIAYLGSHGSEVLMPGAIAPVLDSELQAWTRRVQAFAHDAVRREAAAAAGAAGGQGGDRRPALARRARRGRRAAPRSRTSPKRPSRPGFVTHWGRKVLEIRPPVRIDKGAGIVSLLGDTDLAAAVYVGDDVTDLDAFRGLTELQERGRLGYAVRVGVRSDETPSALEEEADTLVDGPEGVRGLLRALLL